jgi:hypothetical protein
MGYLNLTLIMGIIKSKSNPFEGNINPNPNRGSIMPSPFAAGCVANIDPNETTPRVYYQLRCYVTNIFRNAIQICDRVYSVHCTVGCLAFSTVVAIVHRQVRTIQADESTANICDDRRMLVGGGRHGKFAGEVITKHIHNAHGLKELAAGSFMFEYQCKIREIDAALAKSPSLVSVTVPLHELIPKLTRPELTSIARVHGVGMYSRLS